MVGTNESIERESFKRKESMEFSILVGVVIFYILFGKWGRT